MATEERTEMVELPCVNSCGQEVRLSRRYLKSFFCFQGEEYMESGEDSDVYFVCKVCNEQILKDGEKQAVRHYCRLFVAMPDPAVIYIFSDSERAEAEVMIIDRRRRRYHRAFLNPLPHA